MRRIAQSKAKVVGQVSNRFTAEDGEEFLAAVGPAVEELFGDLPLRPERERGVAPEVAARLNPPPLSPWAVYAVGGAAGAIATAATMMGALWGLAYLDYDAYAGEGKAQGIQFQDLETRAQRVNILATAPWVTAGLSAATALVAGALVPFTEWAGVGAEEVE